MDYTSLRLELILILLMVYWPDACGGEDGVTTSISARGTDYGADVIITCNIHGLQREENITWYHIKDNVTSELPASMVINNYDRNPGSVGVMSNLYLRYFQPHDLGEYHCNITNTEISVQLAFNKERFTPILDKFAKTNVRHTKLYFRGKYYGMFNAEKTWTEAAQFCRDNNGTLLSIQTINEWLFIVYTMKKQQTYDEKWINLRVIGGEPQWMDTLTAPDRSFFPTLAQVQSTLCYCILHSKDGDSIKVTSAECDGTTKHFICHKNGPSLGRYTTAIRRFTRDTKDKKPKKKKKDKTDKNDKEDKNEEPDEPNNSTTNRGNNLTIPSDQEHELLKSNMADLLVNLTSDPIGSLDTINELIRGNRRKLDQKDIELGELYFTALDNVFESRNLTDLLANATVEEIAKKVVDAGTHFVTGSFEKAEEKHNIVDSLNRIGKSLGAAMNDSHFQVHSKNIVLTVQKHLNEHSEVMELDATTPGESLQDVMVNTTSLHDVEDDMILVGVLVKKDSERNGNMTNNSVLSDMLSFSVYVNSSKTSLPVQYTLLSEDIGRNTSECQKTETNNCVRFEKTCKYWNTVSSSWADDGCHSVTHNEALSTCFCNHTTNFAVLVQVVPFELAEHHREALLWITYVGCGLSICSLICGLAIFVWLDNLKSDRTTIHKFLMVTIVLANIIFLLSSLARGSKVGCSIIAVLLHHLWLSTFCWMMVEGFHLYSKVVKVFNTETSQLRIYVPLCFGVPLLAVCVTVAVDYQSYASIDTCWLSMESGQIWGFVGPAVFVMLVNTVVLGKVIYIVVGSVTTNPEEKKTKAQMKAAIKGFVILLPLLGLTWAFGVLALNESLIAFQYLFAILNSLQGLFICIFHCLLNKEVRQAFERKRKKILDAQEMSSGSNPYSLFTRSKKVGPRIIVSGNKLSSMEPTETNHPTVREESVHMQFKCPDVSDNDSGRGVSPIQESSGRCSISPVS